MASSHLISCSIDCCSVLSSYFKLFSSSSTLDFIFSDLHRDVGEGHYLISAESQGAVIDQNLFHLPISQ